MARELAPQSPDGTYQRPKDPFIEDKLPEKFGQFYLYTGNACPWCHRVHFATLLQGLEKEVTVVHLLDDAEKASRGGWIIKGAARAEPVFGAKDLREVYEGACEGFKGRCTAPMLLECTPGGGKRIVSNNSTNILKLLNEVSTRKSDQAGARIDLFPSEIKGEIDRMGQYLFENLNNGVYQAGFR